MIIHEVARTSDAYHTPWEIHIDYPYIYTVSRSGGNLYVYNCSDLSAVTNGYINAAETAREITYDNEHHQLCSWSPGSLGATQGFEIYNFNGSTISQVYYKYYATNTVDSAICRDNYAFWSDNGGVITTTDMDTDTDVSSTADYGGAIQMMILGTYLFCITDSAPNMYFRVFSINTSTGALTLSASLSNTKISGVSDNTSSIATGNGSNWNILISTIDGMALKLTYNGSTLVETCDFHDPYFYYIDPVEGWSDGTYYYTSTYVSAGGGSKPITYRICTLSGCTLTEQYDWASGLNTGAGAFNNNLIQSDNLGNIYVIGSSDNIIKYGAQRRSADVKINWFG